MRKEGGLTCDGRGMTRKWSFCPCTRRRSHSRRVLCGRSHCPNIVRTASSMTRPTPGLRYSVPSTPRVSAIFAPNAFTRLFCLFKHQQQRAQATPMPVKIKYTEHMLHVRQWNNMEQLYDREMKWQLGLYNENVKIPVAHIRAHISNVWHLCSFVI